MNDYKSIKDLYKNSWKMFIQPPRCFYNEFELTDQVESQLAVLCLQRFEVRSKFGLKLKCCLYLPSKFSDQATGQGPRGSNRSRAGEPEFTFNSIKERKDTVPCIIYLHSQGGNVMEGMFLSKVCAKYSVALCVFDFIACGKSEGEYISLGWNEQDDLSEIVEHLQAHFAVGCVGLWGRSMGAVTSLLYAERNSFNLEYIVVDSPFLHLEKSVVHLAKNKLRIPPFLSSMMLKLINSKIVERIGFDVLQLRLDAIVKTLDVPLSLIASKYDDLVPFEDFEFIYKHYGSRKIKMILTDKCHNEFRENFVTAEALAQMLSQLLRREVPKEEVLKILELENPSTVSVNTCTRDPSFDIIAGDLDTSNAFHDLNNAIGNMQFSSKHRGFSADIMHSKMLRDDSQEKERRISRVLDDRVTALPDKSKHNPLATIIIPESQKNMQLYEQSLRQFNNF